MTFVLTFDLVEGRQLHYRVEGAYLEPLLEAMKDPDPGWVWLDALTAVNMRTVTHLEIEPDEEETCSRN